MHQCLPPLSRQHPELNPVCKCATPDCQGCMHIRVYLIVISWAQGCMAFIAPKPEGAKHTRAEVHASWARDITILYAVGTTTKDTNKRQKNERKYYELSLYETVPQPALWVNTRMLIEPSDREVWWNHQYAMHQLAFAFVVVLGLNCCSYFGILSSSLNYVVLSYYAYIHVIHLLVLFP